MPSGTTSRSRWSAAIASAGNRAARRRAGAQGASGRQGRVDRPSCPLPVDAAGALAGDDLLAELRALGFVVRRYGVNAAIDDDRGGALDRAAPSLLLRLRRQSSRIQARAPGVEGAGPPRMTSRRIKQTIRQIRNSRASGTPSRRREISSRSSVASASAPTSTVARSISSTRPAGSATSPSSARRPRFRRHQRGARRGSGLRRSAARRHGWRAPSATQGGACRAPRSKPGGRARSRTDKPRRLISEEERQEARRGASRRLQSAARDWITRARAAGGGVDWLNGPVLLVGAGVMTPAKRDAILSAYRRGEKFAHRWPLRRPSHDRFLHRPSGRRAFAHGAVSAWNGGMLRSGRRRRRHDHA